MVGIQYQYKIQLQSLLHDGRQPRPPLLSSAQNPYPDQKDMLALNSASPNLSSSITTTAVQPPLLPLPHSVSAQQLSKMSSTTGTFKENGVGKALVKSEVETCSGMNISISQTIDDCRSTQLLSEMELLKERNKCMEGELKEMQERYSEISLKFAEVEGERQQLVMTVRNLRNTLLELTPKYFITEEAMVCMQRLASDFLSNYIFLAVQSVGSILSYFSTAIAAVHEAELAATASQPLPDDDDDAFD
ncbi:hypothetical protein CsSME_00046866 [Camellia sinensis var. sinensis]